MATHLDDPLSEDRTFPRNSNYCGSILVLLMRLPFLHHPGAMLDYLLLYLLCLWNSACNIFLWHFRAFFSSFRVGLKFDPDDLVGPIEENALIRPFFHCRSDFTIVVSGVHRFGSLGVERFWIVYTECRNTRRARIEILLTSGSVVSCARTTI
jgi:hypothetical protein